MKASLVLLLLLLMNSVSALASHPELSAPRNMTWCSGNRIANYKFSPTMPKRDYSGDFGFFLCVSFDKNGNAVVGHDEHYNSYNWIGQSSTGDIYATTRYYAVPVLIKSKTLKDGKIAYMYKLQSTAHPHIQALNYRAGVTFIFDPKTGAWKENATFLVHLEDLWIRDTDGDIGAYFSPEETRTNEEFDGTRFAVYRMIQEVRGSIYDDPY